MRSIIYTFVFLLIFGSSYGQISPGARLQGQVPGKEAEALLEGIDLNQRLSDYEPLDRSKVGFVFQAFITSRTSLKDLIKLQHKVEAKVGIMVSYRLLEFRHDSLIAIAIEVRHENQVFPMVGKLNLMESTDFGIFEYSYNDQLHWYVGNKSDRLGTL